MKLNQNQQRAVISRARCIVCIAGPGSGKTRVLTERIKSIIAEGVSPSSILAVTFTNAAAHEIRERIGDVSLGHCGTLHSYMLTLLRKYGPSVLGLPERMAVIDEDTRQSIIEEVCADLGIKPSKKVLDEALSMVPMLAPNRTLKGAELVSASYHIRLLHNGLLDYDSILAYGLYLLQTGKIPNQAAHLLVDEYQDSGDMDDHIYRRMNVTNLFVVGDPDQAIYSFRGGNPAHILKLSLQPTTQLIILDKNYRSDVVICKSADNLIGCNAGRIDKRIVNTTDRCGSITIKHLPGEVDEAREIVKDITASGTADKEIAVLTRTNAQAAYFSEMLLAHGIRVKQRKQTQSTGDWNACRQTVAMLANPENDMLAYQVIKRVHGISRAQAARAKAAKELTTINQSEMHVPTVEVDEVPVLLSRMNCNPASIARLVKIIKELEEPSMAGLTMAMAEQTETEEEGEGVTVGTIHSAKGREWDDVYLPGWQQEVMPRINAKPEDVEEGRRIAFVGVTRARHRLWVSEGTMRKPYPLARQLAPFTPSQFMAELGF